MCACLSICLSFCLSVGLSVCVCLYLSASVYLYLSVRSVRVCRPASIYLSASVYLYLSVRSVRVCRPVYLSVCVRLVSVSICAVCLCLRPASIYLSAPICIYLCGLAAKLFCATSYFPGAAPSKSPVKQHTDTNHSVMPVRWFAGTFRSSAGGLTFR